MTEHRTQGSERQIREGRGLGIGQGRRVGKGVVFFANRVGKVRRTSGKAFSSR